MKPVTEHGFLTRRTVTILMAVFFIALALAVFSDERGVSGVMGRIGSFISRALNY